MDRARYLLGLVTLVFAIAGGVFLWRLLADRDTGDRFHLSLEWKTMRGLSAGADVRYRGVRIGSVRSVRLSEDGTRGVADLQIEPGHETRCCINSKFWIVAPRFSGIAGGASGLDTLIRDAYVAFVTPEPVGPTLPTGSLLAGQERPFPDDDGIAALSRGDLVMTLLVPESHGLQPGSRLLFRGLQIGDVPSLELVEDGTHVRVGLRIDRAQRRNITDKTRFWIARPRLSGALLSGLEVQDVGALLGSYVACHTEPGQGLPVADGFVALASVERPDLKLGEVPREALEARAPLSRPGPVLESQQLVQVHYSAVGKTWWSPADPLQRTSPGILYLDKGGRPLVLTARSAIDAAWCERDLFGIRAKFTNEVFRVVMKDGTVLRAGRSWVDPKESDLGLLSVLDPLSGAATTPAQAFGFAEIPKDAELRQRTMKDSGPMAPELLDRRAPPALEGCRGALVLENGIAVGLLGQMGARDGKSAVVPLSALPELLRPRE